MSSRLPKRLSLSFVVSGMTFGEGEDVQLKMSLREVIPMFFNMSNNGSNYFYDHTNQTQTVSTLTMQTCIQLSNVPFPTGTGSDFYGVHH